MTKKYLCLLTNYNNKHLNKHVFKRMITDEQKVYFTIRCFSPVVLVLSFVQS